MPSVLGSLPFTRVWTGVDIKCTVAERAAARRLLPSPARSADHDVTKARTNADNRISLSTCPRPS
jgi:hypothetical protein